MHHTEGLGTRLGERVWMDKETVGNCMGGELWEQYFYEARFTWVWIVYVYSCLYGIVCLQEKRQY